MPEACAGSPGSNGEEWARRLGEIDWSAYETAYGSAESVEPLLQALGSSNERKALEAVNDLDNALCHQHVQMASAALPGEDLASHQNAEIAEFAARTLEALFDDPRPQLGFD